MYWFITVYGVTEKTKTEIYKINNEDTSSLEDDESYSDNKYNYNIPLEYDKNGCPKRNKRKPKQYKPSFSGGEYEEGVLHLQAEKFI